MNRNPTWKRDELILALDLYFRHPPSHIGKAHPEVVTLSRLLNAIGPRIHPDVPDKAKFRNPNGVYMKLCNFLRLDPTYEGKGLSAGGSEEESVWNEFAGDKMRLEAAAAAIRARANVKATPEETTVEAAEGEEDFPEGRVLFRAHRSRERNATLVAKAKRLALKTHGGLACEICGFDFGAQYGAIGKGYIECHHVIPISGLQPGARTRLVDLKMLCSNCHRMVHRKRPWLSASGLKALLRSAAPPD